MNQKREHYETIVDSSGKSVPIKAWVKGVFIEDKAKQQLLNVAKMPFVHHHVAAMPDVHWGVGATVGSVIPTTGAIIPAAVGVDIGCGMMAIQTSLKANDLPDNLALMRQGIEKAIPHGRTHDGRAGDKGAWSDVPTGNIEAWSDLKPGFDSIVAKHPKIKSKHVNTVNHLGSLGGGNHFIEVCLDEHAQVWFMLHSGSRGVGNRIGSYFIELAREDMRVHAVNLPDIDLAYFNEGTRHFDDYVFAVGWAQSFAQRNRDLMMRYLIQAVARTPGIPAFKTDMIAVNCHHNYVAEEYHFGKNVYVTRKGAVRAGKGEYGIIPGSMGDRSYIVKGLGNAESFESCSHGAGRIMSRTEAKRKFNLEDHVKATSGIECRKDVGVIDETPAAYKSIDAVMEAQKDLVEVVCTLKQVVCVKG